MTPLISMTKRTQILAPALALGCIGGAVAEVTVSASLSPGGVFQGEKATLEVRLSGANRASYPTQPEVEGLRYGTWQVSRQTSITNGRRMETAVISCAVSPAREGSYRIEGVTIQADDKVLRVPPLSLRVKRANPGKPTALAYLSPDVVPSGESTTLTIRLVGAREAAYPSVPEIEGLRFLKWEAQRQSTIRNGRRSESVIFTCPVMAAKQGTFNIAGIALPVDGEQLAVEELTLEAKGEAPRLGLVRLTVNRSEPFVSEPILLTFDFLSKEMPASVEFAIPWFPPKGFLVVDPVDRESRQGRTMLNDGEKAVVVNREGQAQQVICSLARAKAEGESYIRFRFQRLLTPLAAGSFELTPSEARCKFETGQTRSRGGGIFDDWGPFGFGRNRTYKDVLCAAPALKLIVRDLPEQGRPESFAGSVGHFELDASVSPKEVKVGDPITVKMVVSGTGNIEGVATPQMEATKGFRLYEAESNATVEVSGTMFRGQKAFSLPIVPVDDTVTEVPRLQFSFFDPEEKAYRTLSAGPFPITVSPDVTGDTVGLITAPEQGQRKLAVRPAAGVFPLRKPALSEFRNQARPFYGDVVLLLFLPFPALICVVCYFVQRRMSRIGSDVGLQRSVRATKVALEKLKVARGLQGPDFYQGIAAALTGFIADKCNRPPASVDVPTAPAILRERGVPEDAIRSLLATLEKCDLGRFGGSASDEDRDALLTTAEEILSVLTGNLR